MTWITHMPKTLFSFLADTAKFFVNGAADELLCEGSGIETPYIGEPAMPWLGQPRPAVETFGGLDLPDGCTFNSSGALLIDLDLVAASSGLESGFMDFLFVDPPSEVHPMPRQGPLLATRVEAEVKLPASLTQTSAPSGGGFSCGIGWPAEGGGVLTYVGAGLLYHPTDALATSHALIQQAGAQSFRQALDPVNNAGSKVTLVTEFGHLTPTFDPQMHGYFWDINSDQSSSPYSGKTSTDLSAAEMEQWITEAVSKTPRPFLFLSAPTSWEPGHVIELRSFGVR
jgi:hypothetical protein